MRRVSELQQMLLKLDVKKKLSVARAANPLALHEELLVDVAYKATSLRKFH